MSKLNPYLLVTTSAMALVTHSATAKLWFLPDYQENISGGINDDKDKKPNVPNNCASFNGDGSGKTYIQNPDFDAYTCSGPISMANKVKCYYGCKCKTTVSITTGWKCDKYCDSKCVARSCAADYTLSGGNCVCAKTCTNKVTTKPANSTYTYETCTACGTTSQIQSSWTCNSGYTKSGSTCVCATTCSDKITTKPNNSTFTYENCTACGTTTSIKSSWTCNSGYTKSGSTCVCATTCSDKITTKPDNSSYVTETCNACGTVSTIKTSWKCDPGYSKSGESCTANCTLPNCTSITTKPANSHYVTSSCTDCNGTKTINSSWACDTGYSKSGSTCTADCTLPTCTGITTKPANSHYVTSSCTDCSGTKTINSSWACDTGYSKSGSTCVKNNITCPDFWQKPNSDGTDCIDKVCEDYTTSTRPFYSTPPAGYYCSTITLRDGIPSDMNGYPSEYSTSNTISCNVSCLPTPTTCQEWNSSYYTSEQSGKKCTKREAYGLTCWSCTNYTCEDGGYNTNKITTSTPTDSDSSSASATVTSICTEVQYQGLTCWNCAEPTPADCNGFSGFSGTQPECKKCSTDRPDPTGHPNTWCYKLSTCTTSTGGGLSCSSTSCKKTNSCGQCTECKLTQAQCEAKYGKHFYPQGSASASTCWTWYTTCPWSSYSSDGNEECGDYRPCPGGESNCTISSW